MPETRAGLLVTASRAIFAVVLLPWHLGMAASMFTGSSLSMGPPFGSFGLTLGAYSFWLPEVLGATPDPRNLTAGATALVLGMSVATGLLPLMVVAGLATRVATSAYLVFLILAAWLTPNDQWGALFDMDAFSMAPDMSLLWGGLVLPLIAHGGGPISLDRLIGLGIQVDTPK